MNSFASLFGNYTGKFTTFIVLNIAPRGKCVRIFNYPINSLQSRDLLEIPGVSEEDIRSSLYKGEISRKLYAQEIQVVFSDISLLQYNVEQKNYLKANGINVGTEIAVGKLTPDVIASIRSGGSSSQIIKQNIYLVGVKNGVNRTFTLPSPDKAINTDINGSSYRIIIRHNGRGLLENVDYFASESGASGTGFDTITFISFSPVQGSTLVADYATK